MCELPLNNSERQTVIDTWSIQLALVRCGIASTDSPAFIHQVRRLERTLRNVSHGKADSIKQLLDWHDNGRKNPEDQVALSAKIKFRRTWPGASILDTLETVIEVQDRQALIAELQKDHPGLTNDEVWITPGGYDERTGWDNHCVMSGRGLLGYADRAIEAIDSATEDRSADACNQAIALSGCD